MRLPQSSCLPPKASGISEAPCQPVGSGSCWVQQRGRLAWVWGRSIPCLSPRAFGAESWQRQENVGGEGQVAVDQLRLLVQAGWGEEALKLHHRGGGVALSCSTMQDPSCSIVRPGALRGPSHRTRAPHSLPVGPLEGPRVLPSKAFSSFPNMGRSAALSVAPEAIPSARCARWRSSWKLL